MNKNQYNVLLVEDESLIREHIASLILRRPELKLRGIARDGREALERLVSEPFDILFLDIQLPLLSGIDVLRRLERLPYVIFITVSENHALEAFELGAIDYLHKPFGEERFHKAVDRALRLLKSRPESRSGGERLVVSEGENFFFVPHRDILYASSHNRHTVIHTEKRDYETPRMLGEIAEILPATGFIRIHRQYVVNIDRIESFQYYTGGRYIVKLRDSDETELPVSRKYAPVMKVRFNL